MTAVLTHNLKNHWDCAAGDSWNHAFLLAVLLFVPVRYSVKGTVDNNITAEGKNKLVMFDIPI